METETDLPAGATDRRTALKKAAAAAGVVAWATPAVQVLSSGTAHAQTVTGCRPMATIVLKETGEGTKGGDCECVSVLPANCCSNNTSFPVVTADCGGTCEGTVVFPVVIEPEPVFKCKTGNDVSVELSCNNLSPSLKVTVTVQCEDGTEDDVVVTAKDIICIPCADSKTTTTAAPLSEPAIAPEADVSTVEQVTTTTSPEQAPASREAAPPPSTQPSAAPSTTEPSTPTDDSAP